MLLSICYTIYCAIYIHCSHHALDRVPQEVVRGCELIRGALAIVKQVLWTILESEKQTETYENVVILPGHERAGIIASGNVLKLLPLCLTRWALGAIAMARFMFNYEKVNLKV